MSETVTFNWTSEIPIQRFRDLLCSAIEGGSNYWADFDKFERTDLDYISVRVAEQEPSSGNLRKRKTLRAEHLVEGLQLLAAAPFPSALTHLHNFLNENDDAETADVVLQMTMFGDLIYG